MTKIALVWLREDLRIKDNAALSYATQNHEIVTALYVYNKIEFDGKREAQKWWLFKSLKNLQKDLKVYNINLEVLLGDDVEVLANIKNNQDISLEEKNKMMYKVPTLIDDTTRKYKKKAYRIKIIKKIYSL